jgi:tetratricopeptide (TPR) repeat protein
MTDGAGDPSVREKEEWVQQAVAHYERGEMAKAQHGLEKAGALFPENYAVPYYLGLTHLAQSDLDGAIDQWKQYVQMDPNSENGLTIRKYLTLLIREQAREFAKQAVATEAALAAGPTAGKTIAVTSFSNLGSENLGPLGKGMAAMLISDLSLVPDLEVVDRIKLHALLEEMKLGTSGLVNMKTAPRVGRLLRAKHVTSGSLADLAADGMIIASAVVDSYEKISVGAQEAKGTLGQFYELEKKIACQMIEDLGKDCDLAPPGFAKAHTKSMPAFVAYSRGLAHFDDEQYDEAREMFQKALEQDPEFDLAEAALLSTPTMAMFSMDRSQLISTASSRGPSSDTAATAVAGMTVAGTAATGFTSAESELETTDSSETKGFPPMTKVLAGVAVVGGGVALAGGGGGSGGGGGGSVDPGPTPQAAANLTGDWKGTWTGAVGAGGQATLSLTHSGETLSGTVTVTGDNCLTTGNITGSVSGSTVMLSVQSGEEIVSVNGSTDIAATRMDGTWNFEASNLGCIGDSGHFSTTLTTSIVEVNW